MKKSWVRTVYLYTFSLIGLILIIIASVSLLNLGLKTVIFTDADEDFYYPRAPMIEGENATKEDFEINEGYQRSQKQRELAQTIAMLIVGIPLYLFHWRTIKKENK